MTEIVPFNRNCVTTAQGVVLLFFTKKSSLTGAFLFLLPYSSSGASGTEDFTRIVRIVTGPIRPLLASRGKLE